LESIEKAYIHYIMSQTDGKKTKAARILGIDTSTLYRKLDRYDLKNPSQTSADKPRKHSETK
jgi:DNA-binding protein Fis